MACHVAWLLAYSGGKVATIAVMEFVAARGGGSGNPSGAT